VLILLDENLLSKKLKQPLLEAGHSVKNVEDMGWRGEKDRNLLTLAETYPFDVFITADKNLPYQQNLSNYKLRIVVLNTITTRPAHLMPLIAQISSRLGSLSAGSIALINDVGQVTFFNRNSE
jgi:hypothetical protein